MKALSPATQRLLSLVIVLGAVAGLAAVSPSSRPAARAESAPLPAKPASVSDGAPPEWAGAALPDGDDSAPEAAPDDSGINGKARAARVKP
jgi:hypothetical protein